MEGLNWQLLTWTVWAWMGLTVLYMVWKMSWSMEWVVVRKEQYLNEMVSKALTRDTRLQIKALADQQMNTWASELALKEAELEEKMALWNHVDSSDRENFHI